MQSEVFIFLRFTNVQQKHVHMSVKIGSDRIRYAGFQKLFCWFRTDFAGHMLQQTYLFDKVSTNHRHGFIRIVDVLLGQIPRRF